MEQANGTEPVKNLCLLRLGLMIGQFHRGTIAHLGFVLGN